jgi:hypothetical protein
MSDVPVFGRKVLRLFRDPQAFGRWFAGPSWDAWFAVLHGIFGIEPEDANLRELLLRLSGRELPPDRPCSVACFVIGRGGGKSLIASFLACCYALKDYSAVLAPGERATIVLLAADRRQARVLLRYIRGFFQAIPMLGALIERETVEGFDLTNRVTVEIHTASFRSLRGYRIVAAICDEISYWSVDGANPDREILTALGPALARTPGSLLMLLGTPFSRVGEHHRCSSTHFGRPGDTFVVNGDTVTMNPTFDRGAIERAFADDAAVAHSEYGRDGRVEFRADLEQLVSLDLVERNVVRGRGDLLPSPMHEYEAFFDGSGGTTRGGDSTTLVIGHREGDRIVIDVTREIKPPFDAESVIADLARHDCRRFRVRRVTGDRFAGSWPQAAWRKHGIEYVESPLTKSQLYSEMLPVLSAGRLELPDNEMLKRQLVGLERRTSSGGRTLIDHSAHKGAHDDVANGVAGLAYVLSDSQQRSAVATIDANERRFADIEADPMAGLRAAQDADPRFGSWWGNRTFGIHNPNDTPYGASIRARMRAARARRTTSTAPDDFSRQETP